MSDNERKPDGGPEPFGRVIAIYDDGRIVADVGSANGIDFESEVALVDRYDEVVSPYTGERLGFIRHDRCALTVENVMEQFCVLRIQASPLYMLMTAMPFFKKELPQVSLGDEIVLMED